jgi:hypothetical protein
MRTPGTTVAPSKAVSTPNHRQRCAFRRPIEAFSFYCTANERSIRPKGAPDKVRSVEWLSARHPAYPFCSDANLDAGKAEWNSRRVDFDF